MTTTRPQLRAGDWVVGNRQKHHNCLGRLAEDEDCGHTMLYWLHLKSGRYWFDATWTRWLTKVESTEDQLACWAVAQLTR